METLYGPAKQFLIGFTRTLAEEYRNAGVSFTAVCPGVTETEMTSHGAGRRLLQFTPEILVSSAAEVANATWGAMERRRNVAVVGSGNRAAAGLVRVLPWGLTSRGVGRLLRHIVG